MTKVLVTGANGMLGRHVVAALASHGHDVAALVRPSRALAEGFFPAGVNVVRGDLRRRESLAAPLAGVEAVVHLAAAVTGDEETQFLHTAVGTENLLAAMLAAGVTRLVHCSTFSVYDWTRAKSPLDEESPLEGRLYERDGYAIAKTWQERIVRRTAEEHGWRLTVLRPGFIWGPGATEVSGVGQPIGPCRLVFGGVRMLPLTYVENCADCFRTALEHPAAIGQTFNVLDEPLVSAWRYEGDFLRRNGRRGFRLYVPYAAGLLAAMGATAASKLLFREGGKLPGLLMPRRFRARFRPLEFSTAKLNGVLGWRPPFTYEQAWQRATSGVDSSAGKATAAARAAAAAPPAVTSERRQEPVPSV